MNTTILGSNLIYRPAAETALLVSLRATNLKIEETPHPFGAVLIPLADAVQRIKTARTGSNRKLFACSEARRAIAITKDTDRRDGRFLTGAPIKDGNTAYCGGLDAVIQRALVYAQWAEVLCYASTTWNLSEAMQFAAAIHAEFPQKQLGFVYRPRPDGLGVRVSGRESMNRALHRAGYSYYLHSSAVDSELETAWQFVDDAA